MDNAPVPRNSMGSLDHEDQDEHDRQPPSPLLEPSGISESDSFLQQQRRSWLADEDRPSQDVTDKLPSQPPLSAKLHRSAYVLALVLLYEVLALFAWIVTCILTYRPITANHYGVWINYGVWIPDGYSWPYEFSSTPSVFSKNENWYRSARVLQAIASVLAIPLTSTVCSSAAVIFTQHHRDSSGLSIRQVMALADKGWTDPVMYARVFLTSDRRKRYGSSFLLLAMLLHILGGVVYPLQEVFLSAKTMKIPTYPQPVFTLLDIPDQWSRRNDQMAPENNRIVILTRSALTAGSSMQPHAQLWQGAGFTCNVFDYFHRPGNSSSSGEGLLSCGIGTAFSKLPSLTDPFLAQLPSGFSTGLIRQFIPRINSTAKFEVVSAAEYPRNCERIPGAFFVDYSNFTTNHIYNSTSGWGLQACMPADLRQPPWKPTRDRQDFFEELYINTTVNLLAPRLVYGETLFRVTLNTTAGYFELPNYMNNEIPGPLLELDPNGLCGHDCYAEGDILNNPDISHNISNAKTSRQIISNDPVGSVSLEEVRNKGPLLIIAMALFGEGSFITNRIPSLGARNRLSYSQFNNPSTCLEMAPLAFLLADDYGHDGFIGGPLTHCITKNLDDREDGPALEIGNWLSFFRGDTDRLGNAFTAAAFLANQAWMLNNVVSPLHSLTIHYDLGTDTQVPVISRRGIILVSVLLGLDLIALLAMAIYAAASPRWTTQLDSFTMMRLGAAMADKVPLMVARATEKIKALDEIPGWIGDVAGRDEEIGRLGLGAPVIVNSNRRYSCYDGDKESLSPKERKEWRERLKATKEQVGADDGGALSKILSGVL